MQKNHLMKQKYIHCNKGVFHDFQAKPHTGTEYGNVSRQGPLDACSEEMHDCKGFVFWVARLLYSFMEGGKQYWPPILVQNYENMTKESSRQLLTPGEQHSCGVSAALIRHVVPPCGDERRSTVMFAVGLKLGHCVGQVSFTMANQDSFFQSIKASEESTGLPD